MLAHKNYVSAPNLTVKRELHPHEQDVHLKAVGFANAAWKVMNDTIKDGIIMFHVKHLAVLMTHFISPFIFLLCRFFKVCNLL